MSVRMVYLDVDGTLLTPERTISAATLDSLHRVRQRGVRVGLATGRMYRSVLPYARQVCCDAPLILYNGARVETPDTREVLLHRELPLEHARRALRLVPAFGLHCNLYIGERLYVERFTPRILASMEQDNVEGEEVGDLLAFLDRRPVKLLLIGDLGALLSFREAYLDGLPDPPHVVRSEPTYLEILPAGANKGTALAVACRWAGLHPADVMAVGDSYNDLEMIERAGLGVAMGNAPAEVRSRARRVARTNREDGVAAVLEACVLGVR